MSANARLTAEQATALHALWDATVNLHRAPEDRRQPCLALYREALAAVDEAARAVAVADALLIECRAPMCFADGCIPECGEANQTERRRAEYDALVRTLTSDTAAKGHAPAVARERPAGIWHCDELCVAPDDCRRAGVCRFDEPDAHLATPPVAGAATDGAVGLREALREVGKCALCHGSGSAPCTCDGGQACEKWCPSLKPKCPRCEGRGLHPTAFAALAAPPAPPAPDDAAPTYRCVQCFAGKPCLYPNPCGSVGHARESAGPTLPAWCDPATPAGDDA